VNKQLHLNNWGGTIPEMCDFDRNSLGTEVFNEGELRMPRLLGSKAAIFFFAG
jgi:hypothetical protein